MSFLLLIQGIWVRIKTPRLPDAFGSHTGRTDPVGKANPDGKASPVGKVNPDGRKNPIGLRNSKRGLYHLLVVGESTVAE